MRIGPTTTITARLTLAGAIMVASGLALAGGPVGDEGRGAGEAQLDSGRLIRLLSGDIDPLDDRMPRSALIDIADSGSLAIIQLDGPTGPDTHGELRRLGASGLRYLPDGAFVARVSHGARARLGASPLVRWVGEYRPSYRVPPELLAELEAGQGAMAARPYNILLRERGAELQRALGVRIGGLGGQVDIESPRGRVIRATLTGGQLSGVIRDDAVLYVDLWSAPQLDMDNARELSGANYVESMAGYTGQGVRGEAFDLGLRVTHNDFQTDPPIIHNGNAGSQFHGTSVFGIVFGDGQADPRGRGVMPDAQGIFADIEFLTDRFAHTAQLLQEPYQAVFQTNSWGSPRSRRYTVNSAEMDDIIFQLDFTILQSQSNAGNQDSRPQAWAKNIVSVGGAKHADTATPDDDRWSFGGSTGPSVEGRIKPDLTHFYDFTWTTSEQSDTAYTNFGGTSGATPITAGFFGLMYQMWSDGIFGNEVSGGTVFEERPHAATAKALMINSASAYGLDGTWSDFSRFRQGWGRADVRPLFDRRDKTFVVDETDPLEVDQTNAYTLEVLPGESSLRATLVFHDPPGNPASIIAAVNDLSLRLTSPEGDIYWGNVGLLDGAFSVPGGVANTIDTVENVFIANPTPGAWVVEVVATAINEDGRPETEELDADYALVISGVLASPRSDIVIRFPQGRPNTLDAGHATPFMVDVIAPISPDQARLHVLDRQGNEVSLELTPASVEGDVHRYTGAMPAAFCDDGSVNFWIEADVDNTTWTLPTLAPQSVYSASVLSEREILSDNFDAPGDWTVVNENLRDGAWEWGEPRFGGIRNDPPTDFDGNELCFITGNARVGQDVDLGPTMLVSPTLDLSSTVDPIFSVAAWVSSNDAGVENREDPLEVEISFDDGANWIAVDSIRSNFHWREYTYRMRDFGEPTAQTRVRFLISDTPDNSLLEAAIDTFRVVDRFCETCPADIDGNGQLDAEDFFGYLDLYASGDSAADLTGDGQLDADDFFAYLDLFAMGCS